MITTPKKLLSIGSDAKTVKGQKYNYSTAILYLASAKQSGFNVCPSASPQCKKDCLFWSGRGKFKTTQKARINKTQHYFLNRHFFMNQLEHEIDLFLKRSKKNNVIPCVRLNGTSDISWEVYKYKNGLNIFEKFPDLQFYDYTVIYKRMQKFIDNKLPKNYHLTFSRKEDNQEQVMNVLESGFNASVVFEKNLPNYYKHFKVLDGDDSDLRFLDTKNFYKNLRYKECYSGGLVIGLKYKKSQGQTIDKNSFVIKQ